MNEEQNLFDYLLRLADDQLVLGQRLSEWCGHGPVLEEDIAISNIALDCFGQANLWLGLAGQIEGKGRDSDRLAFFRDSTEFRNCALVEQPNGDFGRTIARQFLADAYFFELYSRLESSSDKRIAAIAEKSLKEVRYHLRHSSEWVLRLGDGTQESNTRAQNGFDDLWGYTNELFESDTLEQSLAKVGIAPLCSDLKPAWSKRVTELLSAATLKLPDNNRYMFKNSRKGWHTEHLGHLLAEMQILPRSYPDAKW